MVSRRQHSCRVHARPTKTLEHLRLITAIESQHGCLISPHFKCHSQLLEWLWEVKASNLWVASWKHLYTLFDEYHYIAVSTNVPCTAMMEYAHWGHWWQCQCSFQDITMKCYMYADSRCGINSLTELTVETKPMACNCDHEQRKTSREKKSQDRRLLSRNTEVLTHTQTLTHKRTDQSKYETSGGL